MKAPGKGFLQVCGILLVIFAGISLIVLAAGGSLLETAADYGYQDAGLSGKLIVAAIFAAIELVAGIIFIVNCNKIDKAFLCIFFAVLLIVLQIVSIIINGFTWFTFMVALIGLVLPILCLIGAVKNMNATTVA